MLCHSTFQILEQWKWLTHSFNCIILYLNLALYIYIYIFMRTKERATRVWCIKNSHVEQKQHELFEDYMNEHMFHKNSRGETHARNWMFVRAWRNDIRVAREDPWCWKVHGWRKSNTDTWCLFLKEKEKFKEKYTRWGAEVFVWSTCGYLPRNEGSPNWPHWLKRVLKERNPRDVT